MGLLLGWDSPAQRWGDLAHSPWGQRVEVGHVASMVMSRHAYGEENKIQTNKQIQNRTISDTNVGIFFVSNDQQATPNGPMDVFKTSQSKYTVCSSFESPLGVFFFPLQTNHWLIKI